MDAAKPITVLAYSMPQMGHVNPVVEICTALAQRGHRVVFATAACWQERLEKRLQRVGVEFGALENGLTDEYCRSFGPKNPGFVECGRLDAPLLLEMAKGLQPDVLLADMGSVAMFRVSRQVRVPVVVNHPGQLAAASKLKLLQNCLLRFVVKKLAPIPSDTIQMMGTEVAPAFSTTAVLVNSAWGLELPAKTPPHHIMTGPLAPRGGAAKQLMRESHGELLDFMDGCNKPIVYITTGSLLDLTESQVQRLYEGFLASDCCVIWSLKDAQQKFLPESRDERFYIRSWIPQLELLADSRVKVVLTHCGWGGTLECMQFAKPVIGFPGFADQHGNAALLAKRGCGLQLDPKTFTPATLKSTLHRILEKHADFERNCQAIQSALLATRGSELACQTIEAVAEHGLAHLLGPVTPLHLE